MLRKLHEWYVRGMRDHVRCVGDRLKYHENLRERLGYYTNRFFFNSEEVSLKIHTVDHCVYSLAVFDFLLLYSFVNFD